MRHLALAAGAAFLSLAATPALADVPRGTVAGFVIPNTDIEARSNGFTATDDGDGLGLQAELPVSHALVLTGEWTGSDYDNSTDLDQLRLGIGAVGTGGSGLFAEYTRIEPDGGDVIDGPSIHARLGGDLGDGFSLYGRIGYHFLSDDDTDADGPEFAGGAGFALSPDLGLFAEYRVTDLDIDNSSSLELRQLRLGLQFRF